MARAEIGVFGGSGFYSFLEDVEEVEVETPYGKPSAPFTIGEVGGRRVAFLPRHERNHELPPHVIPYRANLWAMKELGVRRIMGLNASGALKAELELGEFVVCDQFVDRTRRREDTFYDGPETTHVSAADPYCPDVRALLVETAFELGIKARDGGTVVVIQAPVLHFRAESKWFQDAGWDTINMTAYPEGYSPASWGSATRTSPWSRTTTSAWRGPPRLARAGGRRLQREQRAPARAPLRSHPENPGAAARGAPLRDGATRRARSKAATALGASVIKLRAAVSGPGRGERAATGPARRPVSLQP